MGQYYSIANIHCGRAVDRISYLLRIICVNRDTIVIILIFNSNKPDWVEMKILGQVNTHKINPKQSSCMLFNINDISLELD